MRMIKSFFRRIFKDLCHKELLPLKIIFFVKASTLFVLYPYLTIHKRELGINIEETAIMSSITPFVAIVMPPLAGLLADKIGNFKIMLAFFSSLGGAAALLLLLVPVGRINAKYPKELIMDFGCSGNNSDMTFSVNQINYYCDNNIDDNNEIVTQIRSCGYTCPVNSQDEDYMKFIISSRTFVVEYFDQHLNHNYSFKYERPVGDYDQREMTRNELFEHRNFHNNEYYNTAIRQLSKNTLYFPTDDFYQFSCSEWLSKGIEYGDKNNHTIYDDNVVLCKFREFLIPTHDKHNKVNYLPFKVKMKTIQLTEEDTVEKRQRLHVEALSLSGSDVEKKKFNSVQCENTYSRTRRVSIVIPILNSTTNDNTNNEANDDSNFEYLSIDGCSEKCIVTAPRDDMCSNKNVIIEYNPQLTFWLYLMIRVLIGIIGSTAFAMFEGAVIAILREQKADYGLQRIYGSLGGMISSPLSGLLIDYASQGKEYSDFRPAFYLYAALKIASGVLMMTINLEFKAPAHNVIRDFIGVLKNVEIAALMFACFMLGSAWGYLESFLFWLLQDLGGSNLLMGITMTVGGITGIPLLAFSGPIINKIGHPNVLFIGFVFYAIRLIGYSFIYNPWHSLIFEALESVTTSLSFTAAVTYAAKLSTTSTDTSIQGLLGSMYYGVGKGSGSLVGGFIMTAIGTRHTYRVFAVVSIITGIIYFFFNVLYLKKLPQVEGNDIMKKKPKTNDINSIQDGVNDVTDSKIKNNKCDLKEIDNGDLKCNDTNFKALKTHEKTSDELASGIELKKLKKEKELKELESEFQKLNDEELKIEEQLSELKNTAIPTTDTKNNRIIDINDADLNCTVVKTRNSEGMINLGFENETYSKRSVKV